MSSVQQQQFDAAKRALQAATAARRRARDELLRAENGLKTARRQCKAAWTLLHRSQWADLLKRGGNSLAATDSDSDLD